MASYQVVTWKGIPASVEAREGADTFTVPLSERFQMLIDSVAMQLGMHDSDAYMDLWTREPPQERPGGARAVAEAVARELEDRFSSIIATTFARPG